MKIRILIIGLLMVSFGISQSLEETLESLAKDNAVGYLNPAVTAFGTGMNTGLFHTAKPHKMLGFDVTVNIAGVAIPEEAETFDFIIPDNNITFDFDAGTAGVIPITLNLNDVYEEDRTTSTLFGSDKDWEVEVNNDAAVNSIVTQIASGSSLTEQQVRDNLGDEINTAINGALPTLGTQGFNLTSFLPGIPMVVPQIAIGLPMSFEIMLRGAPAIPLGDMGDLSFFGFGGKIGLNQFIPIPNIALPRISIGYYRTNLTLGDVLAASNSITTLQLSKSIPFLTVYGGFGLESSSLDVDYTQRIKNSNGEVIGEIPVKFSIDGENAFRTIVGVRLKLFLLSISADYNMGEYNAFNLGLGLTLR